MHPLLLLILTLSLPFDFYAYSTSSLTIYMASNRNNQRNRPSIDSNRNSMVYSSDDDDDNDADSAVDQSQIRPSDLSEQAHQGRSLQFTESAHMKRLRENPNQGLTLIQNKLYCQPCKKFITPRTNAVQRHCGTEVVRNPTAASNNRSNNGSRHKAAYRVWTNNAARSQPDYTIAWCFCTFVSSGNLVMFVLQVFSQLLVGSHDFLSFVFRSGCSVVVDS